MKTAALLPTPGDTFVSRYWCRNYERVWKGEVDELLVFQNGGTPEAAAAYESVGARLIYEDRQVGHGEALNRLLAETDADVVVLVEDDAYVRQPGAIHAHLARAADGEVIGSPRGGMSPELEVAALEKWGPVEGPDTSTGHGLWPCFLFARTDALRGTDRHFEGRFWPDGTVVPGLGHRVRGGPLHTDTMTSVAFQLRDRGSITAVGQWKELWQKRLPETGAPWFHAGGLSNLDKMPRDDIGGTLEGVDWAHRAWWWARSAEGDMDRMDHVGKVIGRGDVGAEFVAWSDTLLPWINWNDRP